MLSYDTVRQRPDQFLACTGLTVDEFDILLPAFSHAWDEYCKKNYVNSGGGKPKLPRVGDKLFFILLYYKVYGSVSQFARSFERLSDHSFALRSEYTVGRFVRYLERDDAHDCPDATAG